MRALRILCFVFSFFFIVQANAFDININVNGYAGYYEVVGFGYHVGNKTISMGAGTYTFNHTPGTFTFSVDGSGNVTSLKPDSATGSADTLTLSTIVIQVDPQLFPGSYGMDNHTPVSGVQNLTVITNSLHRLITGGGGVVTNFEVDALGNISSLSQPDNVVTGTASFTLKNADLIIDPGLFSGKYRVNNTDYTGIQNVILISGAQDRIRVMQTGTIADIIVKDDGTVTNVGKSNLIIDDGKVTFKTVPVTMYPGYFIGGYLVSGYEDQLQYGEHTFHIVPESSGRLSTRNIADAIADFTVDEDGDVTWFSGSSVLHQRGAMFLKNQNSHFAVPSGFNHNWMINTLHTWPDFETTDADLYLVPYKDFHLFTTTVNTFQVTDCLTDVNISTGTGTFVVTCVPNNNQKLTKANGDSFVNIGEVFEVQHINTKFSSDENDFVMTNNGAAITLTSGNINDYLFSVEGALVQGRNVIDLSGKDENAVPFNQSYIIWAGGAEVKVQTTGATDTVTIYVEQFVDGIKYTKSVVQQAVAGVAIFNNIPQIEDGVVHVSVDRNLKKKILRHKLAQKNQINLL